MAVTQADAYWKFDESSGNAADSTSGGKTLTNNGTATYGSGALNNAVDLGTTKYMTASDAAVFDASSGFSVSFWYYQNAAPASAEWSVFSKWDSSGGGQESWNLQFGINTNAVYLITSKDGSVSGGSYDEWDSASSVLGSTAAWHHCAFTYNATSGSCTLYIDNVSKTMTRRAAQNVTSIFNGNLAIGIGGTSNGGKLGNLRFDEYGYWKDYQLTASEIGELYNSGTPIAYESLWARSDRNVRKFVGIRVF